MTDIREAMRAAAASNDLVAVDVPEWEQKVYIRKLTVRDQKAISEAAGADPVESAMRVLMAALCYEDGSPLLEEADRDLLMDQPFPVIMPLLIESARVNGVTSAELEEAVAAFQGRPVPAADTPSGAGASPDGGRDRGDAD